MPSGLMPTYGYIPSSKKTDPHLRTCSSSRGRLFAGGTYFRSREPGLKANLISVQVIEYVAPDQPNPDAVCVVTNYALNTAEMVTGPVTDMEIFDIQLKFDDRLEVDQLDTVPRARNYSISFKIAPPPEIPEELGTTSVVKLFGAPGKLAAKLTPPLPIFTALDKIVVTRRRRIYRLVPIMVTDPMTFLVSQGWDIANLRAQVYAGDPWIEMLERSGPIDDGMGGMLVNPNPVDAQDTGSDAQFLTPFAETRLGGAGGLPDNPDRENTGPSRSLVHVNYGEAYNGTMAEVNIVYEWQGKSAIEGAWVKY